MTKSMPKATGMARQSAEMNGASEPVSQSLRVMAILSTLMGFASISTDLYLPALPRMASALGANTGQVEWTISGYLVGFSLGQLLWGPISDRHGRRMPVAIGLVLFCLGSAGCALSANVWAMIGWRALQAVGACAGVVLARAMVRDLFPQDKAAKMLSLLITIMAIAPLIGPLAGGQILALGSWRAIFWLLVVIGLATLAALFTIPETLPAEQRAQVPLGQVFQGYATLLRDPHILAYAGIGGFFYLGIYAYIAGTPFAYIDYYHVAPSHYGWLFAAGIMGIMGANMINAALSERFGSRRLMGFGTAMAAFAGTMAAITTLTGCGGLIGLVLPLLLYCAAAGLIIANSIVCALSRHPDRAGSASALVGAAHYGSGIAGSGLVGMLANGTPVPLGMVMALGGVGALLCMSLLSLGTRSPVSRFTIKE